jgi:uncharacterized protein (TIGR00369 family)
MIERTGPFWDTMAGKLPLPPSMKTLGWELLEILPEEGRIRVACFGKSEFLNAYGSVQGGFLAAMLDDTMAVALYSTLAAGEVAPMLELKVNFLRPAKAGRLTCDGHVVHRGGGTAFLEGSLHDAEGRLCATATATVRIMKTER